MSRAGLTGNRSFPNDVNLIRIYGTETDQNRQKSLIFSIPGSVQSPDSMEDLIVFRPAPHSVERLRCDRIVARRVFRREVLTAPAEKKAGT